MKALVVAALVTHLAGCQFAVKHPSVTAGIVVGTLGLATCSLTTGIDGNSNTTAVDDITSSPRAKCYGVAAGAGIGIALITSLALWLGYEDEVSPATGGGGKAVGDPTNLPPAPVFVPRPLPKPEPKPAPEPKPEPAPEPPPVEPAPTP